MEVGYLNFRFEYVGVCGIKLLMILVVICHESLNGRVLSVCGWQMCDREEEEEEEKDVVW